MLNGLYPNEPFLLRRGFEHLEHAVQGFLGNALISSALGIPSSGKLQGSLHEDGDDWNLMRAGNGEQLFPVPLRR
ncbi:hypothetical protein AO269_32030 [Pseudomonas putida]|nr:hypothetical protein AO269_32030 [Pseudomonas putida]